MLLDDGVLAGISYARANTDIDLDNNRGSGDIESDFGQAKQDSLGPGSHLKHVSGDAGTVIRVESFSGDIQIGRK